MDLMTSILFLLFSLIIGCIHIWLGVVDNQKRLKRIESLLMNSRFFKVENNKRVPENILRIIKTDGFNKAVIEYMKQENLSLHEAELAVRNSDVPEKSES